MAAARAQASARSFPGRPPVTRDPRAGHHRERSTVTLRWVMRRAGLPGDAGRTQESNELRGVTDAVTYL